MSNYYKEVKRSGDTITYKVFRTKDDSLVVEGKHNYTSGGILRALLCSYESSMEAALKEVNREADLAIKSLDKYEVLNDY